MLWKCRQNAFRSLIHQQCQPAQTLAATLILPSHQRHLSTSKSRSSSAGLAGSTPPASRSLVLFTGRSFNTLPSHLESVSSVYSKIVDILRSRDVGIAVTDATHPLTKPANVQWSKETSRFEQPQPESQEEYGAVIYPDRISIPVALSQDTLKDGKLQSFLDTLGPALSTEEASSEKALSKEVAHQAIDIFVCTHGARDCRCGDVGNAFYEALVMQVKRRKLGNSAQAFDEGQGPLRIHRVTHIGGHRFAATCFTSTGDWYGLLSPSDASVFVDYLVKQTKGMQALSAIWWDKWRGRSGISAEEQTSLHADALKALSSSSASAIDMASLLRGRKQTTRSVVLGDAFDLPVQTFDNLPLNQPVRAYGGETIMDALRRHKLVEATCGGACECATCHIHLRPSKDGPAPPVSDADNEEEDQLEYAIGADDHSRLACQVRITDDLQTWLKGGGRVQLPRY